MRNIFCNLNICFSFLFKLLCFSVSSQSQLACIKSRIWLNKHLRFLWSDSNFFIRFFFRWNQSAQVSRKKVKLLFSFSVLLSLSPACLSKEIVFIKLLLSNLSFLPKNLFFFLKSHVWQISVPRTRETQIPKFYLVLVFRSSVPVY